jgi:hypothetical protein
VTIADFDYTVRALWLYSSQTHIAYKVFQPFDFERHLMKVIPETRRVHCTKVDISIFIGYILL